MGIDDSYELMRQKNLSRRIGLTLSIDRLSGEVPEAYNDTEAVQSYLKKETTDAIGEVPEFTVTSYTLGRGAAASAALVIIGGSLTWLLSKAKNIDDGVKTIKKWAIQLKAWKLHFSQRGQYPSYTVEALKILCAADLYERFDIGTEPHIGLIRADASGVRDLDGSWMSFGPVYVFIPDKRKKVTHLYAISYAGEILHRGEIPPFELDEPKLSYLELDGSTAQLCTPDETTDPDVVRWNEMRRTQTEDDISDK